MHYDDERTLSLMEKYPKPKKQNTKAKLKSSTKIASKPKRNTVAKPGTRLSKKTAVKRSFFTTFLFKTVSITFVLLFLVLAGKYLYDNTINYNPLIGTWRTKTMMGIMEVSFTKESVSSFGSTRNVSYDIHEREVIVMDEAIKIGESYQIIDKDTIITQSGATKLTFKRVR